MDVSRDIGRRVKNADVRQSLEVSYKDGVWTIYLISALLDSMNPSMHVAPVSKARMTAPQFRVRTMVSGNVRSALFGSHLDVLFQIDAELLGHP
jgi:hypothetical protein